MSEKIKLFVVDDHEVVITGVEAVLSKYPDIEVIGTANEAQEAIDMLKKLEPDIVIMDVQLPDISGIELTRKLLKNKPEMKIIFHTSYIDEENIINGFEAGALGYVPKTFKSDDLVDAIRTVHDGNKYLKGIVSQIVVDRYMKGFTTQSQDAERKSITEREKEVLRCIAMGMVNKQVADKLNISQRTVEAHKSNIMKKLNLETKSDLIIYAIKKGIISI